MRRPPGVRALLCLAALAGLAGVLHRLGSRSLDVPLGSATDLQRWFDDTSPATMAAALVRASALLACGYLFTVVALGVLADLAGWRSAARFVARATPAVVRRVTRGGAQVGLCAGVLAPAAPVVGATAEPQPEPPPTVTMVEVDANRAVATMVRLDDVSAAAATWPEPIPPTLPVAPPVAADTWIVARGESFWSIAEDVLTEDLGRTPSDAEITPYWRDLVAANRDRLAALDQPDLLLIGQELHLPVTP